MCIWHSIALFTAEYTQCIEKDTDCVHGKVIILFFSDYRALGHHHWGVCIRWTGPLDWTTGLDYWTHE